MEITAWTVIAASTLFIAGLWFWFIYKARKNLKLRRAVDITEKSIEAYCDVMERLESISSCFIGSKHDQAAQGIEELEKIYEKHRVYFSPEISNNLRDLISEWSALTHRTDLEEIEYSLFLKGEVVKQIQEYIAEFESRLTRKNNFSTEKTRHET